MIFPRLAPASRRGTMRALNGDFLRQSLRPFARHPRLFRGLTPFTRRRSCADHVSPPSFCSPPLSRVKSASLSRTTRRPCKEPGKSSRSSRRSAVGLDNRQCGATDRQRGALLDAIRWPCQRDLPNGPTDRRQTTGEAGILLKLYREHGPGSGLHDPANLHLRTPCRGSPSQMNMATVNHHDQSRVYTQAIYKLEGDRLTHCASGAHPANRGRSKFTTRPGDGNTLVVLQRFVRQ